MRGVVWSAIFEKHDQPWILSTSVNNTKGFAHALRAEQQECVGTTHDMRSGKSYTNQKWELGHEDFESISPWKIMNRWSERTVNSNYSEKQATSQYF